MVLITQSRWWWGWWSSNDKWWFATSVALTTAYPVWQNWWFAVVWDTDTVWVWDSDTSAWVNSGIVPTSDHSALSNLDYNSSGHTGFQPALEKAHDWVSPNDYCWLAPLWSVISDAVWTITRIVVANDWTTTSSTLTNVKWNDRLTLPF